MQMLEAHPFWGHLLMQVKIVARTGLGAIAATDCIDHIWIDPERTQLLSLPQLGFVLAHEVGHQALMSHERARGRDRFRWNCATDYAINRIVAGMQRPGTYGERLYEPIEGILLDHRFDGMIAESIYEQLDRDALPEPTVVALSIGSAHGGDPKVEDHGGAIDVHLPLDLTPEQVEELDNRVRAAVRAWEDQDRQGHCPGDIARRFSATGPARVHWTHVFRQFAQTATARDDYALCRPNPRYLEQGFVVPGRFSERTGQVVVAVDTSGSMRPDQLDAIGRELGVIASEVEELIVIVADSEVQQVVVGVDAVEAFLAAGEMRGGGGTDHRPVFAWTEAHGLRPDLFIGVSDLYSSFPGNPPPYPVLWLVPRRHGEVPFGQAVSPD